MTTITSKRTVELSITRTVEDDASNYMEVNIDIPGVGIALFSVHQAGSEYVNPEGEFVWAGNEPIAECWGLTKHKELILEDD